MSTSLPDGSPAGFSRRRLLAGAAGLALLAAGCTAGDGGGAAAQTSAQDDRLAAQLPVQEAVVAAYDAAVAADPALGGEVAPLAEQARTQLERLRAAAPGAAASSSGSSSSGSSSSGASSSGASAPAPPAGGDVRGWLREQVAAAAAGHAAACVEATGARAALLGAVAAGLRGHEAALA
ncbi:hypothetical protein [Geodermatophilus nigrescens]|uniref:DUF4439 domain-containing protein n=1 Tax=Geodermatophilus nigrescens TaxID=1070870 RepID=A0A1M5PAP0_9ACTN|nr:hypothetical protein [Geodermatophilus nigrescens]SHG98846.1 hypothetical protein SAMN05444351_3861 [Geodermatophilus nigrescens]